MNKKGFTLIEVIAVIIIIGILLIVTVPAVSSYINSSRKTSYVSDVSAYLETIQSSYEMKDYGLHLSDGEVMVVPFSLVKLERGSNDETPFGEIDFNRSYAVITVENNKYQFYANMVDTSNQGIVMGKSSEMDNDSIEEITDEIVEWNYYLEGTNTLSLNDKEYSLCETRFAIDDEEMEYPIAVLCTENLKEPELSKPKAADYSKYLRNSGSSVSNSYFGYALDKTKIEKITLVNSSKVPSSAVAFGGVAATGVDISNNGDGSAMMWLTDKDGNGMYELFIGQDGVVVANPNSNYLFYNFINVTSLDIFYLDSKNATSMYGLFDNLGANSSVCSINGLSGLDVSNVTDMRRMFYYTCDKSSSFNVDDLSKWDTSKVTDMSEMFQGIGGNAVDIDMDLSTWNVSKVTNMIRMFYYAGENASSVKINLSKWDVSKVTRMDNLFGSTGKNATTVNIIGLNDWNVSNVTNMSSLFDHFGAGSKTWSVGNLSGWNTSNVTNMSFMFSYAGSKATAKVNPNVSGWNVSKVTNYGNFNSNATWITSPTWVN